MKAYRRRRGIAPRILHPYMEMVIFKLRPLYAEKEPRYLLPRVPCGLQSQSGNFEGREELSTLQGFQPQIAQSIA